MLGSFRKILSLDDGRRTQGKTGVTAWAAMAACLALSPLARGAIVDFEDISSPVSDNIEFFYGGSVDSEGYRFAAVNHASLDALGSWKPAAGARYSGSVALWPNYVGDLIRMSKVDGGAFSVSALDMADVLGNNDDRTITIIGTHTDTTTVTDSFDFTDSSHLLSYNVTGMTNLISMTIYAGDFPFQMDNVQVVAVPEPAVAAIGCVAVGGLLRRRRKRA